MASRRPRREYVYLMGSPDSPIVKIGRSNAPQRRLAQVQETVDLPLQLMWTTPGGNDMEKGLHDHFAIHRRHGEWFELGFTEAPDLVAAAVAANDWPTESFTAYNRARYCLACDHGAKQHTSDGGCSVFHARVAEVQTNTGTALMIDMDNGIRCHGVLTKTPRPLKRPARPPVDRSVKFSRKFRRATLTPEQAATLREMYEGGAPVNWIAEQFGISRAAMYGYLPPAMRRRALPSDAPGEAGGTPSEICGSVGITPCRIPRYGGPDAIRRSHDGAQGSGHPDAPDLGLDEDR